MLAFFDNMVNKKYLELYANLDTAVTSKEEYTKEYLIDLLILYYPQTEAELLAIPGWDIQSYKKMGQIVLNILNSHKGNNEEFYNKEENPFTRFEAARIKRVLSSPELFKEGENDYLRYGNGINCESLIKRLSDALSPYTYLPIESKVVSSFLIQQGIINMPEGKDQEKGWVILKKDMIASEKEEGREKNAYRYLAPCLNLLRNQLFEYLRELYTKSPFARQLRLTYGGQISKENVSCKYNNGYWNLFYEDHRYLVLGYDVLQEHCSEYFVKDNPEPYSSIRKNRKNEEYSALFFNDLIAANILVHQYRVIPVMDIHKGKNSIRVYERIQNENIIIASTQFCCLMGPFLIENGFVNFEVTNGEIEFIKPSCICLNTDVPGEYFALFHTEREYGKISVIDSDAYLSGIESSMINTHMAVNEVIRNSNLMTDYDWNGYNRDYHTLSNRIGYSYIYGIKYSIQYQKDYYTLLQEESSLLQQNEITVISVGCGLRPDYVGLRLALNKIDRDDIKVRYLGLDVQDWDEGVEENTGIKSLAVPFASSDYSESRYRNDGDIFEYLTQLKQSGKKISPDIIIFPTSYWDVVDIDNYNNQKIVRLWDGILDVLAKPVWVCITFTAPKQDEDIQTVIPDEVMGKLKSHVESAFSNLDERAILHRTYCDSVMENKMASYFYYQNSIIQRNDRFCNRDGKKHFMANISDSDRITWNSWFIKLNPEGVEKI